LNGLRADEYFDIYANMKLNDVVDALGALAHPSRLDVFRMLVRAGPGGLPAGTIAERIGLPPPTLSFHLAQLAHADLVVSRRVGRSIIYAASYPAMSALLAYLTENCCAEVSTACAAPRARRAARPTASTAQELRT
jgi:ArsR family transcriptional regulator, arsenate/arsenite/antimonite-responsive transcriptional repressor